MVDTTISGTTASSFPRMPIAYNHDANSILGGSWDGGDPVIDSEGNCWVGMGNSSDVGLLKLSPFGVLLDSVIVPGIDGLKCRSLHVL